MTRYIIKLNKGEGEQVQPYPIVINEKGELAEKSVWRGLFDHVTGFMALVGDITLFTPVTTLKTNRNLAGQQIMTVLGECGLTLPYQVESVEELSE